jgi:hypothetical protein
MIDPNKCKMRNGGVRGKDWDIYATDHVGSCPIVGWSKTPNGGKLLLVWQANGANSIASASHTEESPYDLIPQPEIIYETWINIYPDGDACLYPRLAEAKNQRESTATASIHLTVFSDGRSESEVVWRKDAP